MARIKMSGRGQRCNETVKMSERREQRTVISGNNIAARRNARVYIH